ncbi:porin [Salinivibrio proteolyticus]|uniref:porin n=1 Tax=Salinivibrio proteolyticus TaxID=334715 RepID=UPI000988AEC9|nr:porin [Salinivibrio proteolyticus]OOF23175.1 porin [Salinivibrio proteolyticus]
MNKIFKRSLISAVVALGSTGAMAADHDGVVGVLTDYNVDLYGVAAISAFNQEDGNGYDYENESRVGVRAGKAFNDDVYIFMQIESGYVGEDGTGATLGNRDTFIGMKGDWGQIRFGRMLTPMYEVVDWPYSNPGLGRVFDWGADTKSHYDRKGDIARYDSPDFSGFSFDLSVGRGDKDVSGSNHFGAALHYTLADAFTLHGGYEYNSNYEGEVDTKAYLAGIEVPLPGGFKISAAYKYNDGVYKVGDSDPLKTYNGVESEQEQISVVGDYWNGPWGFRLGYAANGDSDLDNNVDVDDSDSVIAGQLMYSKNGFLPYLRIGQHDAGNLEDKKAFARLGIEYSF